MLYREKFYKSQENKWFNFAVQLAFFNGQKHFYSPILCYGSSAVYSSAEMATTVRKPSFLSNCCWSKEISRWNFSTSYPVWMTAPRVFLTMKKRSKHTNTSRPEWEWVPTQESLTCVFFSIFHAREPSWQVNKKHAFKQLDPSHPSQVPNSAFKPLGVSVILSRFSDQLHIWLTVLCSHKWTHTLINSRINLQTSLNTTGKTWNQHF